MSMDKYFSKVGSLSDILPRYRQRDAQLDAANFIFDSMKTYQPAVVEAPTGSGKTFAYLIPAFELGRRTIISTKTKQLMSQIAGKDIEAVNRIFGDDRFVAVLKGRRNYFCHLRFFRFVYPNQGRFERVVEWYGSVVDQEIIDVPIGVFSPHEIEHISTDSWQCTASKCEFYDICSFYRAKEQANSADIVITNHYLLMSDFALKSENEHASIFDFADHIIMDEAHSIPDIFPRFAGTELSLRSFLKLMNENRQAFDPREIELAAGMLSGLLETIKTRTYTNDFRGALLPYIEFVNKAIGEKDFEEMKNVHKRLVEKAVSVLGDSEGVRFVEQERGDILLQYIPLNAADKLREGMKNACLSPVFVSATLSGKGNFSYFLSETGYEEEEIGKMSLEPVFDMAQQGRLLVQDCDEAFYEELALKAKGSVLIICNSVGRMLKLTKMLKELCPGRVYSQRDIDIKDTEGLKDTIFVGCAVFREGMDFAHTGISYVVLDKLPFEYPDDLVLKEQAESVRKKGQEPFMDYFLPRAVIYYRQAVGRLLRHEDDKGVWVVLDRRIDTKNYGKYFATVLKDVPRINTLDEAVAFLEVEDAENEG
ncbi:ATP-dependent DNA helicase [Deferribacteres bacterium DY0609]|nr:ATP-dependent DNA helicase [Denitrovibrio acetiphilus]